MLAEHGQEFVPAVRFVSFLLRAPGGVDVTVANEDERIADTSLLSDSKDAQEDLAGNEDRFEVWFARHTVTGGAFLGPAQCTAQGFTGSVTKEKSWNFESICCDVEHFSNHLPCTGGLVCERNE